VGLESTLIGVLFVDKNRIEFGGCPVIFLALMIFIRNTVALPLLFPVSAHLQGARSSNLLFQEITG
jgi:hypothetical protein